MVNIPHVNHSYYPSLLTANVQILTLFLTSGEILGRLLSLSLAHILIYKIELIIVVLKTVHDK